MKLFFILLTFIFTFSLYASESITAEKMETLNCNSMNNNLTCFYNKEADKTYEIKTSELINSVKGILSLSKKIACNLENKPEKISINYGAATLTWGIDKFCEE